MRNDCAHQSSAGHIFLGLFAGAAFGAATALLLAPARGADTREAIRRRASEQRDRVHDTLERGRQSLTKVVARLKVAATEGRSAVESVQETAVHVAGETRRGLEKAGRHASEAAMTAVDAISEGGRSLQGASG